MGFYIADVLLAVLSVAVAVRVWKRKNAWTVIGVYWCIAAARNIFHAFVVPWWGWILIGAAAFTACMLMACFNMSAEAEDQAQKMQREMRVMDLYGERTVSQDIEDRLLREAMEEEQW